MSWRALTLWLSIQVTLSAIACVALRAWISLDPQHAPTETRILTVWRDGQSVGRQVFSRAVTDSDGPACKGSCTRIVDRVVDEGPLPAAPLLFAISVVAARDGIAASIAGQTAYLTPDDLLARQAESQGAR